MKKFKKGQKVYHLYFLTSCPQRIKDICFVGFRYSKDCMVHPFATRKEAEKARRDIIKILKQKT